MNWLIEQDGDLLDILALPETAHWLDDGQQILREEVTTRLSRHLPGRGWYEPFAASRPIRGRRYSPHVLLVKTALVHPLRRWNPTGAHPGIIPHGGFLICEASGHEVAVTCKHWEGGAGRAEFDKAAQRLAPRGEEHPRPRRLQHHQRWDREHRHDIDWEALQATR